MDLIIDFYKSLDTLNLIIFWGVIIVIILLLIFSFIMINKNKKLTKMVEKSMRIEEDIPIKHTEEIIVNHFKEPEVENIIIPEELPVIEEVNESIEQEETNNSLNNHINNDFNAEELVIGYAKEEIKEESVKNDTSFRQPIQMPTGPYQRNVLREMALSQTSPIGINRKDRQEEKKNEIVKDLEDSLNNLQVDEIEENNIASFSPTQRIIEKEIKQDLEKIEDYSERKTEILIDNIEKITPTETKHEKNSSEKYLEEVSKKLSEAEIPDEIERTDYELEQEENAIISYKELMEKKDSIETIDEEDAVISIEELMLRANKHNEVKEPKVDNKLYNITEQEENESFIKELKQFRKDL